jgi:alpha-glucosidase
MNRFIKVIMCVVAMMVGFTANCHSARFTLTSPDGRIVVEVGATDEGAPYYTLTFDGESVLEQSSLGIVTSEEDYTSGLELMAVEHSSANKSWEPVWGERAVIMDKYNAIAATFRNEAQKEIVVEFRA